MLFGYRNNRPAKGSWFVPGGRIMQDAFKRISHGEIGIESELCNSYCLGPYEHFCEDNISSDKFSTHYVALGYRIVID